MVKKSKADGHSFPGMFFHPKSGDYVICNAAAEVPDGFVDDIKKVKSYNERSTEEIKKADVYVVPAPTPEAAKDEDTDKTKDGDTDPKDGDGNTAKEVTLKSLELSRKDAIKLLKEAKIEHKGNATNNELAALIAANFDDEDDEDDDSK